MTITSATPITQTMMTLCALSPISAVERPSGELLLTQAERMRSGINQVLTGSGWTAVWVGLTPDRANMGYIATGPGDAIALCLRGTQFTSLVDLAEDLEVGTMLPFNVVSSGGNVSQGSMRAFTAMTAAKGLGAAPLPPLELNLVEALQRLVEKATSQQTLYVTGHSLGGAMATMLGVYLAAQTWSTTPVLLVYTFAAPTAGDAAFAACFDGVFPSLGKGTPPPQYSVCVWNKYDAVPNAWQNLEAVKHFFPILHGPRPTLETKGIVDKLAALPGDNLYVQPTQQDPLNVLYTVRAPPPSGDPSETDKWMDEVAFQHQNSTYLTLLEAKIPPSYAPAVTAIAPNNGPATGGEVVTLTGVNFTSGSVVDFGTQSAVKVSVISATEIYATAPAIAGVVDVRVTTAAGTSAPSSVDLFYSPSASPGAQR